MVGKYNLRYVKLVLHSVNIFNDRARFNI